MDRGKIMEFEGKKVLITGAASGIGRATAIRFAAAGAQVTIGDINAAGLEETAGMMASTPKVVPYDACDFDSCRALVDAAATDGLDVLCNISGMIKWGPSLDFAVEDFERILKVNTTSVFVLCQAALPHLVKSKGNIVNTASTAALQGLAYTIAYSASKHAVAAITKGLAIEFAAKGVRVNAICPGHVDTPLAATPPPTGGDVDWSLVMRNAPKLENGSCEPLDIAEMFAYLASERARKVTGSLFTIDGGQLAG
ncbi:MAG: SDR family NAD(P)-dependent oxidoreductase [Novosphingobium sp.]|nr:SDR family NAD(P)-dependent oxidoreductase [Novosphingobium sp.]